MYNYSRNLETIKILVKSMHGKIQFEFTSSSTSIKYKYSLFGMELYDMESIGCIFGISCPYQ